MPGFKDYSSYIGQKFGLLTLEEIIPERKNGRVMGRFRCECGNETFKPASKTIQLLYKSCGCLTTSHPKSKKRTCLTKEHRVELGEKYKGGAMASELAREYGLSRNSTLDIIDKLGITRHTQSYSTRNANKIDRGIEVNDFAFSGPIDEAMAYWIGFMMADGRMLEPNLVSIILKDHEHVHKLRDFLGSTHAIGIIERDGGSKSYSQLQLHSTQMYNDLCSYGVVPRKSLIAVPPESLMDDRHFWRGVIDGDGSVTIDGPSHWKYIVKVVRLCGTAGICNGLLSHINGNILDFECHNKLYYHGPKTCEISIYGKKAAVLAEYFYKDAMVFSR